RRKRRLGALGHPSHRRGLGRRRRHCAAPRAGSGARLRFTRLGSRGCPRYPRRFHLANARRRSRNRGPMTAELAAFPKVTGFLPVHYAICLKGIVWREGLRFLHQRERFVAGMAVSLPQVYTFLAIAWFWEIEAPPLGYIAVLPALVLSGLMLGAMGMLMSSVSKQLENFAGAMNFVIFPMFFASSALYPLW